MLSLKSNFKKQVFLTSNVGFPQRRLATEFGPIWDQIQWLDDAEGNPTFEFFCVYLLLFTFPKERRLPPFPILRMKT